MDSNTPAASVPAAPDTVTWIREPDDLDRWLAEGQGEPLALDTEFERVNTFFRFLVWSSWGWGSGSAW